MANLPFDLYPHITRHITLKCDLVELSQVSRRWRVETETILWRVVTVHYDDSDSENIGKLEFLIDRGAAYVKQLDIDYASVVNAHRNDAIERSESFLKAVQAISKMDRLEQIDIYCNGDMAALLLSPSSTETPLEGPFSELEVPGFPSFPTVRTIKYLGACSPPLYRFLRLCTHLQSLRFSNNLEPTADYSLLYHHDPSGSLGEWNALATFSGNIFHVAAILRSPIVSQRLKNLTIHLQPAVATIQAGFAGVSPAPGIETLGLGDLSGYKPFSLGHVLRDLADALPFFPNVKRIQRAPFYDRVNRRQLLETLSVVPKLTYLSLLVYETFVPTKGLELAKELMERTTSDYLRTVVCIPCPNGPTAAMFRRESAMDGLEEDSPDALAASSDGGNDTSSGSDLPSPLPSSSTKGHDGWVEGWIDLDEDTEV